MRILSIDRRGQHFQEVQVVRFSLRGGASLEIAGHICCLSPQRSLVRISLVCTGLDVHNSRILDFAIDALDKCLMCRIPRDVVISVLCRRKLNNEAMREPSLSTISRYQAFIRSMQLQTCSPSGLLSIPPLSLTIYGFWASGWMHFSFRSRKSLHICRKCQC